MSLFSLFRSLAFFLVSKSLPNYLPTATSSSSSSSLKTYDSRIFGRKLSSLHSHPFFLSFSLSPSLAFFLSLDHSVTHSLDYTFTLSVLSSFSFVSGFFFFLSILSQRDTPRDARMGDWIWRGGFREKGKGMDIFYRRRRYKAKSN